MEARPGDGAALLPPLSQIPGTLGKIRLDPDAYPGDPSDPHDVVGADLKPVEGLVNCRPRAGQVGLQPLHPVSVAPAHLAGGLH